MLHRFVNEQVLVHLWYVLEELHVTILEQLLESLLCCYNILRILAQLVTLLVQDAYSCGSVGRKEIFFFALRGRVARISFFW